MVEVKRLLVLFGIGMLLFSLAPIVAQDETTTATDTGTQTPEETTTQTETQTAEDNTIQTPEETTTQTPTEFNVDPGLTPDDPLYFVDNFVEKVTVGDNPENALNAQEEKIAEAQVMIAESKPDEARQVLEKALQYGDVVEKEGSPEMRDRIQESSQQVQNVLQDLKEQAENQNMGMGNNFDKNIEQQKQLATAVEIAAKINELCSALAKLDPLQYTDTCKSGKDSPKWMQEQDKQLTKEQQEQAKVFFDKLSQCMESPKDCDCKGMGVQSFEDFCVEKSVSAVKCEGGDEEACKSMSTGNPEELLPDYLVSTFKKVESKYMKAEFDMYIPEECSQAGAKTSEQCSKVMFQLNAPRECLEAGYTGKSAEDEIKCRKLMFKENSPQECTNAGINSEDKDAPRKCAKLMFTQNAPQKCIDAGLTGESSSDDKKCRQLMEGQEMQQGQQQMAPKFNRDCKVITDTTEKMKCFEEFYNNAQVQVREEFRTYAPGTGPNEQGCQSSQQIENLKQDCKSRGQNARVEDRGGCPWVICMSVATQPMQVQQQVQQSQQEFNPYGSYNPYVKEDRFGQKCPDGICDDFEKANPYACPVDCGGEARQPVEKYEPPRQGYTQQQPPEGEYQPQGSGTVPGTESAPTEPNIPPAPAPEPTPSPTPETTPTAPAPETTPTPSPEVTPTPSPESAPATGAIFWNYYFK